MKRKILALMVFVLGCVVGVLAADKPSYPGGDEAMKKFITTTLIYPATAMENGVEGVVNVAFTVNPDGSIAAVKIVRMIDPDLEKEAIRIVKKMPAWIPADKEGVAIEAPVTIAIPFTLPESE